MENTIATAYKNLRGPDDDGKRKRGWHSTCYELGVPIDKARQNDGLMPVSACDANPLIHNEVVISTHEITVSVCNKNVLLISAVRAVFKN